MENWWIKNWCFRAITASDGGTEWVWRFPNDEAWTPTGDLVSRFEAERMLGLNDDVDFVAGGTQSHQEGR